MPNPGLLDTTLTAWRQVYCFPCAVHFKREGVPSAIIIRWAQAFLCATLPTSKRKQILYESQSRRYLQLVGSWDCQLLLSLGSISRHSLGFWYPRGRRRQTAYINPGVLFQEFWWFWQTYLHHSQLFFPNRSGWLHTRLRFCQLTYQATLDSLSFPKIPFRGSPWKFFSIKWYAQHPWETPFISQSLVFADDRSPFLLLCPASPFNPLLDPAQVPFFCEVFCDVLKIVLLQSYKTLASMYYTTSRDYVGVPPPPTSPLKATNMSSFPRTQTLHLNTQVKRCSMDARHFFFFF